MRGRDIRAARRAQQRLERLVSDKPVCAGCYRVDIELDNESRCQSCARAAACSGEVTT